MGNIFSIKNKTIFITGSTRGIGKELALKLAALGAYVIVHGRNKETAQSLAKQINGDFVYGDLSDETQTYSIIENICQKQAKLDVLINNAGFEDHAYIEQMDMQLFDKIQNICMRSHYILTQGLIPLLKNAKGASIINMSSIHQNVPVKANSPYCMAKAAMEMFTKVLALELAPHNIRANNLAPGAIRTEMNADIIAQMGEEQFQQWIPMGRVGNTEEMVGPVVFLASSASSYMTGATLYVDGGYTQNLLRYAP